MKPAWKPWHELVELRDDLRTGELSLSVFAADLHDVVMQKGERPVYEDPAEFFALTHPTYNLRELVKDVVHRLAGQSDKAYRKLSINYGGGKTHSLITLRHLVHDPACLPDIAAVEKFKAHIGSDIPKARIAALCFDKIDLEKGIETSAPDGTTRMLKHPWSILAYQLAGDDGLKAIHADGKDEERETPPAEPLLVDLISMPQKQGLATLILLDEALMYLRSKVEADEAWRGRLLNFFQYLTQAVVKVDRCALVASLLASDPRKHDELGKRILAEVLDVFGRQMEEDATPVGKKDVAEVLRRRFFKPDSIRDTETFLPHVTTVVGNIAALDEQTKKDGGAAEERYLESFPFHPSLTEVFYTRWTQVDGFQRTRGMLRTFAIALRDAETWDESPLVGANVFLSEPGKSDLAKAARELCQVAGVDPSGDQSQQWTPILEGELAKAQDIQSETTGLRYREVEQAVITVFLNSQPIGHKASTQEMFVLLGMTKPDRIELEKALRRWAELSWFLDEVEVGTAETDPAGTQRLPKAWRLGNRPNLRQMHHDACNNRVQKEHVEAFLIDAIERLKPLTDGATAAGAKVHKLPEKPGDVQDDGEFHYVILGSKAAVDSGKPSADAKRFIDETTASDRPRFYRNAIVLAVPSKDGLEAARARIREHLGWLEVREQLKGQKVDPVRDQMLAHEIKVSHGRIPETIRQAYSIVVTVNEHDDIHAFKIMTGDGSLFTTIKADKRARIQETAINPEAMMPGEGPYDLWREDETSRRVKDLVGAFAQFAKLPKMLRRQEILDTVVDGVRKGIWVAQLVRPDRSVKTFWRSQIDESALQDPGLEILMPSAAALTELAPDLLAYQQLPELWPAEEISVGDVLNYFAGGHEITVPMDGYSDTFIIPKCEAATVEASIGEAVVRGHLWLTNGPASVLGEPVPAGVLASTATLQPPPDPITVDEMTKESIPDAWRDDKANALAISTAMSAKRGKTLPWPFVRDAISKALRSQWFELTDDSDAWPCEIAAAQHVVLRVPDGRPGPGPEPAPKPPGLLVAEATLSADRIQDLADEIPEMLKAAVDHELNFGLRVELGGETESPPDPDTVERINNLLAKVSENMKLG